VTVERASADLLAGGAGSGLDQVVALVVDVQGGVVEVNGDDLVGVVQKIAKVSVAR
jgi:hypothetical protein